MGEKTYSIRRVSEMLEIESYVLRYYEKELKLDIHRNVNGHRIYSLGDIELLKRIKEWREQGLELKAVKNMLDGVNTEHLSYIVNGDKSIIPEVIAVENIVDTKHIDQAKGVNIAKSIDITRMDDTNVMQFSMLIRGVMKDVLTEVNEKNKEELKDELKEVLGQEINTLVEKKVREMEVTQTEKREDYYYKLDEAMREMKRMQKELALLRESEEKVGFMKKLFGNKNSKKYQNDLLQERQEI